MTKARTLSLFTVTTGRLVGAAMARRLTGKKRSIGVEPPKAGRRWTRFQWATYYKVLNIRCGDVVRLTPAEVKALVQAAN